MSDANSGDISAVTAREALAGRLPIRGADRLYTGFGSLLAACVAIGAASFNYLFGASIAYIGNTSIGILGYLIGLIVGLAPVYLASGLICYRHGVDPVDAAKSSMGTRGSSLLLALILITTLGWSFVLIAMTGQAAGRLQQVLFNPGGEINNGFVAVVSAAMLVLIWVLLRKGPLMIALLTRYTSPAILIIACVLVYLITRDVSLTTLLHTNVDPKLAYASDPLLQLAYGVEFGAANALTSVPFFGGIARLIQKRKHVITPSLLGAGVIGAVFTSAVGALAAIATGSTEPAEWVVKTAGNGFGTVIVSLLLLANLGTLISFFYFAGVSVQQVRFFAKMRWDFIVAILLLPGLVVAFNTQWLIAHVMNWLAYNSAMFVGIAAVMLVDYLLLRRQVVLPAHLFVKDQHSAYWFWGGVNWVAMATIALGGVVYLLLFDPLTLQVGPTFRYVGATMPTLAICMLAYYLAMRVVIASGVRGGYRNVQQLSEKKVRVGL
ncbi:cytosine permease [Pseudomonas turukhanskensis]|uniref:Cytosine permease n=1 Tax=Pseudomonas turukhanskensis TaxID=1806536 RepID=A0A9W6NHQ3_9PSED|nr:cytosine permease [Pseudomonas turukhanskensis]GLK91120.1 cytosine permease [Pseudomonas turukhanskensis]